MPDRLPHWVAGRDGRPEPFDGDRIYRSLFAAATRAGRPDPFLARELADAVLHFVAAGDVCDPLPVAELTDTVAKVVREVGQPVIARAYQEVRPTCDADDGDAAWFGLDAAESGRRAAAAGSVEDARQRVLTPDLRAAEAEGLLTFFDLDAPGELAGVVLPAPAPGRGLVETIEAARDRVGQYVAIDAPETSLADPSGAAAWVRELRVGLRATGLRAVVNLNASEPPTRGPGEPSLFPNNDPSHPDRTEVAAVLAEHLLEAPSEVRVDWHLGPADFVPAARSRLLRLARWAAQAAPIAFVPDRPRQPVALAEGLDRRHRAALAVVGVGLPRFLQRIRTERPPADANADVFDKLGSLTRLALTAGRVRREFLRRHGRSAVRDEFFLDRARLVVVPLGLDAVARAIAPDGRCSPYALQILHGLNAAIIRNSPHIPSVLDSLPPVAGPATPEADSTFVPPRQQLRADAALHTAVGSGTATVRLAAERPAVDEVADLICHACQQPGLIRFRFAAPAAPRTLAADW